MIVTCNKGRECHSNCNEPVPHFIFSYAIQNVNIPVEMVGKDQENHEYCQHTQSQLPPRMSGTVCLRAVMPCGWLYTFAIVAAGTGSPWWGAAVMAGRQDDRLSREEEGEEVGLVVVDVEVGNFGK